MSALGRAHTPSASSDDPPDIHVAVSVSDERTAVAVDSGRGVEVFECETSMRLGPDGLVELDHSEQGIRGVLFAVGDPRGLRLDDGRVVRAEDLVAGFVQSVVRMAAEVYSVPPDASCAVLHPTLMSAEAVAALRDALDYVGMVDCSLSEASSYDPAVAVRTATAARSAASLSAAERSADRAFAAMVSESASGGAPSGRMRRAGRAVPPTRVAVGVAAVALAFLAVGGAVGTRSLDSNSVAPLNSQQAIPPAAPVLTSTLDPVPPPSELPPESVPPVEQYTPEPEADAPESFVPTPATIAVPPITTDVVPFDQFPFAPPSIDFPELPTFPSVTVPTPDPTTSTTTSTTAAPGTTTTSERVAPPVVSPDRFPLAPVTRP